MINRILKEQAGVITTKQLASLGMNPGKIKRITRRWSRVTRGLYLTESPSFDAAIWAGWLAGGDGAAIGEYAAAYRWGFVDEEPDEVVVWAPEPRVGFQLGQWGVRFRRASRPSRRTPPLTLVEDTVLDCANAGSEVEAVAVATRALADGFTTVGRLLDSLRQRSRQRHRPLLQDLCAGVGVESVLEFLFDRNVIVGHGLPRPTRQASLAAGRVDCHYDAYRLIVELDGGKYHNDKARDFFRDNEHLLTRDEVTLRFGWFQANGGACQSARQLARGLRRGGWSGTPRGGRCRCLTKMDQVSGRISGPSLDL